MRELQLPHGHLGFPAGFFISPRGCVGFGRRTNHRSPPPDHPAGIVVLNPMPLVCQREDTSSLEDTDSGLAVSHAGDDAPSRKVWARVPDVNGQAKTHC